MWKIRSLGVRYCEIVQDLCLDERFLNGTELVRSRCVPNRGLEEDRKSGVTNTGMVSD